jgi:hypothetical protein
MKKTEDRKSRATVPLNKSELCPEGTKKVEAGTNTRKVYTGSTHSTVRGSSVLSNYLFTACS